MGDYVTIPLRPSTRDLLKGYGSKGETYDMLVRKLIDVASHSQLMETHYRRLNEKDHFVRLEEL